MNSFAMIFGKCVWIPPSPKAAVVALSYFFGTMPGVLPTEYEAQLREQMVAAGAAQDAAMTEVKWLVQCFGTYSVPQQH
jgi:hypothetical protein